MFEPEEAMLKEMAARQAARNECGEATQAYGAIGGLDKCAKPSLTERLRASQKLAQQQARKAESLAELAHLLGKNPELARILDLLDSVGGL